MILETLGGHIGDKLFDAKFNEWHEFSNQVHAWEVEQYLKKY